MNTKDLILEHTARTASSGYGQGAGSYERPALKTWHAHSASPSSDIDPYSGNLRQRGRALAMNNPVAAAALNTIVTNVIGTGLKLQSRVDVGALGWTSEQGEAFQDQVEREFAVWSENASACDATGVNNFYALQRVAVSSSVSTGEVYAVFSYEEPTPLTPYALRVRFIEADRCATPSEYGGSTYATEGINPQNGNTIYDGIEVNSDGKVVAYHFRSTYPYEWKYNIPCEWTRIPAYGKTGLPNVLHVMEVGRPEQYHGATIFAPCMEESRQADRYLKAELSKAVTQSYLTAIITSQSDPRVNPFNPQYPPEPDDVPLEHKIGQCTFIRLKSGESVSFPNSSSPAAGLSQFEEVVNKHIFAAIGLPAEVGLKKHDKSYSASRASRLDADSTFALKQAVVVEQFVQPVYEMWMAEAVARGRIDAPGFFTDPILRAAYLGAEWVGPTSAQLDPLKEANSWAVAVEHGWVTNAEVAQSVYGTEFDQNVAELEREAERMSWAVEAQPVEPPEVEPDDEENNEPDEEEGDNDERGQDLRYHRRQGI